MNHVHKLLIAKSIAFNIFPKLHSISQRFEVTYRKSHNLLDHRSKPLTLAHCKGYLSRKIFQLNVNLGAAKIRGKRVKKYDLTQTIFSIHHFCSFYTSEVDSFSLVVSEARLPRNSPREIRQSVEKEQGPILKGLPRLKGVGTQNTKNEFFELNQCKILFIYFKRTK